MQPCPADSTNRSRSAHFGSRGLCFKCRCQRTYAIGAAPRGRPGCPDSAFWTASIASVRIVSTQSSSRDFRTALNGVSLSEQSSPPNLITRPREFSVLSFQFSVEAGSKTDNRQLTTDNFSNVSGKRVVLAICDGWGEAPPSADNAIALANTPT